MVGAKILIIIQEDLLVKGAQGGSHDLLTNLTTKTGNLNATFHYKYML